MNVAVVGIGDWGKNLVRTFEDVATVRTCVHTGSPANERWLAAEDPGIEATTDYGTVLDDDAVDAVVVATPIPALADVAERALRADKHVYVEKPMAATRSGAEHLAALADERDRRLFVGYVFVHHPVVARIRERLDGSPPEYLRLEWDYVGSFDAGLVNNFACHPVSVATNLFDAVPGEMRVTTSEAVTGTTDLLDCTLGYPGGQCDVYVDRLSPREPSTSGTVLVDGDAYVFDDDRLARFDPGTEGFETVYERDAEPLAAECRAFVDCVTEERTPITDGAFGVDVHRVLSELKAQA